MSHGASVHGLPALRQVPANKWLDVAMIRVNQKGVRMNGEDYDTNGLGNVSEVVTHVHEVRKQGMGVISMKLMGEGTFNHEDRKAAMRFAFRHAGVDSVSVGYKDTAEIDEAIENLSLAIFFKKQTVLNSRVRRGYRYCTWVLALPFQCLEIPDESDLAAIQPL